MSCAKWSHALRTLVVIFGFASLAGAASEKREAMLGSLKRAFPVHTAGPVDDKSDPLIRECFLGFQSIVAEITLQSLPQDVGILRKRIEREIARHRQLYLQSKQKNLEVNTPSARRAIEQNLAWLTQKLRPYVARLETFQRGKAL